MLTRCSTAPRKLVSGLHAENTLTRCSTAPRATAHAHAARAWRVHGMRGRYDLVRAGTEGCDGGMLGLLVDVLSGCAYLHACKPPLLHRDLKPPNVLHDEKMRCKLCASLFARNQYRELRHAHSHLYSDTHDQDHHTPRRVPSHADRRAVHSRPQVRLRHGDRAAAGRPPPHRVDGLAAVRRARRLPRARCPSPLACLPPCRVCRPHRPRGRVFFHTRGHHLPNMAGTWRPRWTRAGRTGCPPTSSRSACSRTSSTTSRPTVCWPERSTHTRRAHRIRPGGHSVIAAHDCDLTVRVCALLTVRVRCSLRACCLSMGLSTASRLCTLGCIRAGVEFYGEGDLFEGGGLLEGMEVLPRPCTHDHAPTHAPLASSLMAWSVPADHPHAHPRRAVGHARSPRLVRR